MKYLHLLLPLALLSIAPLPSRAQSPSRTAAAVPALFLSDIHLDPFHDPAKFSALLTAPAAGWAAILYGPTSPTQAADFAHLQETCNAKGIDTTPALLQSSLRAAHQQQPHPLFVTISGDLMVHQFDCRFHTLNPSATPAEYSAFASKTVAFIALQLRQTFSHTPIYFALGNNDSGCNDYGEDPDSDFLHAAAANFSATPHVIFKHPGHHEAEMDAELGGGNAFPFAVKRQWLWRRPATTEALRSALDAILL